MQYNILLLAVNSGGRFFRLNEYKIKDLPLEDRPREKLIKNGVASLTDSELLAILIRTGNKEKSALQLSCDLLKKYGQPINLATSSLEALASVKGIGTAKAVGIIAALELGRRIAMADALELPYVYTPDDAAKILMPLLRYETHEHFYIMLLNIKNKILCLDKISAGTADATLIEPKTIFAQALQKSAAALILAHNHPSGQVTPSDADELITQKIVQAGKILDIQVVDHLIIGDNTYYSFKENRGI